MQWTLSFFYSGRILYELNKSWAGWPGLELNNIYASCYALVSALFRAFHCGCIRSLTLQVCARAQNSVPERICQILTFRLQRHKGWNQNSNLPEQMCAQSHYGYFSGCFSPSAARRSSDRFTVYASFSLVLRSFFSPNELDLLNNKQTFLA